MVFSSFPLSALVALFLAEDDSSTGKRERLSATRLHVNPPARALPALTGGHTSPRRCRLPGKEEREAGRRREKEEGREEEARWMSGEMPRLDLHRSSRGPDMLPLSDLFFILLTSLFKT